MGEGKKKCTGKVEDPQRARVERPAKSNFSLCVFTGVAIAGKNVLCQRLAVLSVIEVQ